MTDPTELIARSDEHIRKLTDGLVGFMAERSRRGEGDDERVSLLVRTTRALEAQLAETTRLQAVIDASHYPDNNESINLGYYRTQVTCICGGEVWWGEHEGDPTHDEAWSYHVAGSSSALEAVKADTTTGWSTEDRRVAEAEAKRRFSEWQNSAALATRRYADGSINGFVLGAEWQNAREAKADTSAPPAFVNSVPNDGRYEYTSSSDCDGSNPYYRARVPARHAEAGPWFPISAEDYAAASKNWRGDWLPVETEGESRG